jgi:hypothetical protein
MLDGTVGAGGAVVDGIEVPAVPLSLAQPTSSTNAASLDAFERIVRVIPAKNTKRPLAADDRPSTNNGGRGRA